MRECLEVLIVSCLLYVGQADTCLAGPTDEAAKQDIEQKLQETEVAWKANDAGRAVGLVENAYQFAKTSLEPRDPLRRKVLITYTMFKFVNAQNGHEWTANDAADLLAEVEKNFSPQEEEYQQIQFIAMDYQGACLLEKAQRFVNRKNGNVDEAHQRLCDDTETLRKTLQQAGVDQAVAELAAFKLAKFQQDHKLLGELQRTLDTIGAVIKDERVAPQFRRDYFNQMGLLQTELQNFATARDFSGRARNLAETTNHSYSWAQSQINLGLLALRRGDYREATTLLEEVHAKRNVLGPGDQVNLMNNLAKVSEWNNDYGRAQAIINETLELVTKEGQQNAVAECLCFNNRAINAYLRGKFEDAQSDLTKARELAQRHFGSDHLRVAEVDVNLGWVDLAFDKVTSAERRFRTAAGVVRERYGDDHPRTAEMLSYQARALFRLNQPDAAREVLLTALDLQEQRLERVLRSSITERDRLAYVQNLRVHAESPTWPGVFDTFMELAPQLGISNADQYAHVLTWKGIVADYRLPPPRELEDDPPIRELVTRRNEVLQQLRAAYVREPFANERSNRRNELDQLQQRANELEIQLRSLSPRFTASFGVAPMKPARIQECLSDAAALLDIVQVRRYEVRAADETVRESTEYVGFVLKSGGHPIRIDFGPAQPINDAIRMLLQQLPSAAAARGFQLAPEPRKDAQAARSYQDVADELRTLVVKRLQPQLENVRVLITAPDGAFHRIPLSLLPGAEHEFWIQELAFATTPTAQGLVRRRETPADHSGGLLAVGAVDFGADWQELKGTGKEVDEIKTLFENSFAGQHVELVKGRDATKERLLTTLPKQRYVHFATHGAFADQQTENSFDIPGLVAQLDSRLVLSEPEAGRPRDEQYLTAEELGGLPLQRTELVVLSACDTGLGFVSAGQTVIGMIGALDQAGVKTILGSLWKVDDEATVELMKAFYDQLWAHQLGPAEALRSAQLKLIGESSAKFRHPKYWAAFIVAGEPGDVANDDR